MTDMMLTDIKNPTPNNNADNPTATFCAFQLKLNNAAAKHKVADIRRWG